MIQEYRRWYSCLGRNDGVSRLVPSLQSVALVKALRGMKVRTGSKVAAAILSLFCVASAIADSGDDSYSFATGLYARGQWDTAAKEFEAFLSGHAGHPREDQARFYLGEALVQQNRFLEARKHFDNYLQNTPDGRFTRQCSFDLVNVLFSAAKRPKPNLASPPFPRHSRWIR